MRGSTSRTGASIREMHSSRSCSLCATLVLALAGCASSHAPRTDAPLAVRRVRIEPATVMSRATGEEVIGTVRARDAVEIAPSVMGRVTELNCTVGAHVRAGDLIARLSVQELSERLRQARESLAQATIELSRATQLHARGAVAPAEYDAALSRHRLAQSAQAEASAMARYATVRAPFAGVVTTKLANAGDTAMPGRPLCVVEDPTSLRLEATVPEKLGLGAA